MEGDGWHSLREDANKEEIKGEVGLERVYVDDVTVPRALLEICEVLLHEMGRTHVLAEMLDDYDLTIAQLREHLR